MEEVIIRLTDKGTLRRGLPVIAIICPRELGRKFQVPAPPGRCGIRRSYLKASAIPSEPEEDFGMKTTIHMGGDNSVIATRATERFRDCAERFG
jgi:hypothetical protein